MQLPEYSDSFIANINCCLYSEVCIQHFKICPVTMKLWTPLYLPLVYMSYDLSRVDTMFIHRSAYLCLNVVTIYFCKIEASGRQGYCNYHLA